MAELQFAGEFSLDRCELISSSGVSADISKIIVEINIFEDIFSNALTGSIIITDTNNLVDNIFVIISSLCENQIIKQTPIIDNSV